MKTPLESINTNLEVHHTAAASHTHSLFKGAGFRDTGNTDTETDTETEDHSHHDHVASSHIYTPTVKIVANRTTNLIPVQSGNVQADGEANSQSVSNDENSPTEGDSECEASFLGSFACNIKLILGGRRADVSERRSDNTEEEKGDDDLEEELFAGIDVPMLAPTGEVDMNEKDIAEEENDPSQSRTDQRGGHKKKKNKNKDKQGKVLPRKFGRQDKQFSFEAVKGLLDMLWNVVII